MGEGLFNRIKNIVKKEGKVIFVDGDDIYAMMLLEKYENCPCNVDFKEETVDEDFVKESLPSEIDDKELMKRVNEDIAKWREEQQTVKKEEPVVEETNEDFTAKVQKLDDFGGEDTLMEEEKYYLEPLE